MRERILELLRDSETHPTAAWVHERLKKEFPRVAVGTVYRNLNILVSEGLVRSVSFDQPVERFDACLSTHCHLICERCGSVRDAETPLDDSVGRLIVAKTGFAVRAYRLDFYGVCGACRK